MTCIHCLHWNLKDSPLRAAGFGRCKTLGPEHVGRAFSSENPCRFGKFAQAPAATVDKRVKGLS
jgi:hypothetical protein